MGNVNSNSTTCFTNYEFVQDMVLSSSSSSSPSSLSSSMILINTLPMHTQSILIANTLQANREEVVMNELIKTKQFDACIVIYGKNCLDESPMKKYRQLTTDLGFRNVHIYLGGMFEWLCLHEIYSNELFPIINSLPSDVVDILQYKP